MRVGAQPGGHNVIRGTQTQQRSAAFYIAWFYRLSRVEETGWYLSTTPDGRPIIEQDAFFWNCLESICVTHNVMMAADRAKP